MDVQLEGKAAELRKSGEKKSGKRKKEKGEKIYIYDPFTPGVISGTARVNICTSSRNPRRFKNIL